MPSSRVCSWPTSSGVVCTGAHGIPAACSRSCHCARVPVAIRSPISRSISARFSSRAAFAANLGSSAHSGCPSAADNRANSASLAQLMISAPSEAANARCGTMNATPEPCLLPG